MKTIHAWNVKNLRVIKINETCKNRLKSNIINKFGNLNIAANFYSKRLDININTIKTHLRGLFVYNNFSIPFYILSEISIDNKISMSEIEKSLLIIKGEGNLSKPITSEYPLKIKKVKDVAHENNAFHSWEITDLQAKRINKEFAEKIKKYIILRFCSIDNAANHYSKLTGYKYNWTRSLLKWIINGGSNRSRDNIPVNFLMAIAEDNGISKIEVEKSLKRVKIKYGTLSLLNPKFPISVSPALLSLATHFYGDGWSRGYSQAHFHILNRRNFFNKIENSIGTIDSWNHDAEDFSVPTLVFKIFESTLKITKNNIREKRFPAYICNLPKEFKLAMLSSIILDEGNVSQHFIRIKQKRKHLLGFFYNICKELEYDVSEITSEKKYGQEGVMYLFNLRVEGMHKFYGDLQSLTKKYGDFLDLGDKQNKFECYVNNHINCGRCKLNNRSPSD